MDAIKLVFLILLFQISVLILWWYESVILFMFCALLLIWVICYNLVIMYLCFLWINFSFQSNYLLWNLSYETNLLNGNVLWTISTYHYSIIGFIDLIINIILWTTSWMLVVYYFSFKVSIECVLVTIISVNWTTSLTWYSL